MNNPNSSPQNQNFNGHYFPGSRPLRPPCPNAQQRWGGFRALVPPQHSTRGSLNSEESASFPSQNGTFFRQNMQDISCQNDTFHSNQDKFSNEYLPLAPPPLPPPPLLPQGIDCNLSSYLPSLCSIPPPERHGGSSRYPLPDGFRQPPLNMLASQRHLHATNPGIGTEFVSPSLDSTIESKWSMKILKSDVDNNDDDGDDQRWMQQWTEKLRMKLSQEKSKRTKLKVSDIQKKLLTYVSLVYELEIILEQLKNEESQQEFEKLYAKSDLLKGKVTHFQSYFDCEDNIKAMNEALVHRRQKRLKSRQMKKRKVEKRKKIKEIWKEKQQQIDERLKRLYEQERNKVIEEKIRREADMILREVRMKQEEVNKMKKLLQALTHLRETRMKKGEVHGYVASSQANAFFTKLQDEFRDLLANQLDVYQGEEQTLKVMIESKNTFSQPSRKSENVASASADKIKESLYQTLFGRRVPKERLNEFQKSFISAEESFELLIKRRHEWDQFLVDETHPIGTSIPIGWVVPNAEPNDDWSVFQKE